MLVAWGDATTTSPARLEQYDEPDWEPLVKLVGELGAGDFMWMQEHAFYDD